VSAARFGFLPTRTSDRVGWRLLTTNNRDLGRSSTVYPDHEAARLAAQWVQEHVAEMRITLVRSSSIGWRWRMLAGDTVVAVASRDYHRRLQAERSAAVMLTLLPLAAPLVIGIGS
jgi:hypothetical protein